MSKVLAAKATDAKSFVFCYLGVQNLLKTLYMQRNLFTFLAFILMGLIFAQPLIAEPSLKGKLSPEAREFTKEYEQFSDQKPLKKGASKKFAERYNLTQIDGNTYVRAVLLTDGDFKKNKLRELDVKIGSDREPVMTVEVSPNQLHLLPEIEGVSYIKIGGGTNPNMDRALADTRTDSVREGLELPQSYSGEDVVIAVIDWGFDYKHPNFLDAEGEKTRIIRAWDQNKASGPAPEGFNRGTEYVGHEELMEAEHDTFNHLGIGSHGTSVAGIAGGNGAGTDFEGIAPKSELIFVSLDETDASKIDAFNYVADVAEGLDKPVVVNMSFGRNVGPHDGTDLDNQAIDAVAEEDLIFVGAAGNRGNNPDGVSSGTAPLHIKHEFEGDTMGSFVEFADPGLNPDMWGQTLNMWGSEGEEFSAAVQALNDNGDTLFTTSFYASEAGLSLDTVFAIEEDTFHFKMDGYESHPKNDRPSIMGKVRKTGEQKLALLVTSDNTTFHAWNSMRKEDDFTNHGYAFQSSYAGIEPENFIEGNNHYSVSEPGGTGRSVVTVGAHQSFRVIQDQLRPGRIAKFSGRGPTTDGRIKPDLSAPGVSVNSSASSEDDNVVPSTTVEHEGKSYPFRESSGTSMSAPVVSGIVALMLEANPKLSFEEISNILRETAYTDEQTGEITDPGITIWGYGKANALAAMQGTSGPLTLADMVNDYEVEVWPNPAKEKVNLDLGEEWYNFQEFNIYDNMGKKVYSFKAQPNQQVVTLNLPESIGSGMYILSMEGDKIRKRSKLLVE